MNSWFETLDGIKTRLWETLEVGLQDATHPARTPTFATISPDGWPEARTVVLRSANRQTATLTIHTDRYSHKIQSLQNTPRGALHIWDAAHDLQIRLQVDVSIEVGDSLRTLWENTPDHSKQSYGVTPSPGQPIKDALNYVKDPDPTTFAVLHCSVAGIDAVHLGDNHRRARYSRSDDWAGQWLSP